MWGGAGGADTYCNCATGQPVNLSSGDYYDTQTDLTIPGAGIPLTFSRTYDAEAAQAEESSSASAGPLGYGWTDNLNMSVSYNSGTGLATVTQANGSEITFQYYATGATEPVGSNGATWCPSDATSGVFCPTAPRYIATLSGASGGTGGPWTFVNDLKSPITYSFTTGGVLSEITDATGDTVVSSSYSPGAGQASCPTGDTCVAWSSTPSAESSPAAVLVEAFNSSAQLVRVFDAASGAASTQLATFAYSGSGCSTWSGTPVELCSVTDPGSLATSFTYDTGKSSPYQYDETTMTPPATGAVTNTYDSSGRIASQVITTGGTSDEQDFSYATNSTVTNGTQTTVTDYPNGTGHASTTATYLFSNGVEVGLSDGTGDPTYVNRDPATLLPDDSIDGDGNDTGNIYNNYAASGTASSSADVTLSTDGDGNVTQSAYTAANLPWCTVDAADYANGTTCPSTEPTSPPTAGTHIGYTLDLYNSSNELTSTTDPLGNTTVNAYTSGVSGVPSGLRYCTVDPVDEKASVTCPAYGATHVTGTATETFDATGDVLTSTDADGDTTTYTYSSAANPGLPTTTTDPDGTKATDTYNAEGEVTTQVVTGTSGTYSATTQYGYDTSGRRFCEVDPYEYSSGVRCPSSVPTSPPTGTPGYTDTIYNSNGQVTTTTNPIGGTTQYAYDGSGNRYCTVTPTNYATGTRCPTTLPLTTPTVGSDSYLGATIDTFDADNRVTQVTNPLGGITATSYDAAGNVTETTVESNSSTSAPNVVTEHSYDGDNRVISTTLGYGSTAPATTLTSYDPDGNAYCVVSANADAAGSSAYQCPVWQTGWAVTPPSPSALYSTSPTASQANNVSTDFFNADGVSVQTTTPDLQTSVTAVDADGRTYCTSDPVNVASWLTANPSGTYPYLCPSTPPTTAPTTATGYVTSIIDPAGRTLSSTDQLGDTTSYAYDPAGNTTTTTDPRGKVTTNCYYWESGTGQCAASAPAAGGSLDDLYSVTSPATTADPSGETTTYTYLPGDTTHVITTPSGTTTDSYDADLDLAGVAYSSTASGYSVPANQSYTFFADGTRHTMTDGSGTTTYTEDANDDITQQQLVAGRGSGLANTTVSYGYFTTGAEASVTYPSYGTHTSPEATYTYDPLGNMATETDWLGNEVTFAHDGDGNLTAQDNDVGTSNPTGTSSTSFSYDNADLNTQASSTISCSGTNGSLTQAFSGTGGSRNADGQVTEDSESYAGSCAGPGTAERNYSYDQADRVVYQGISAQGTSPNNIVYDASGDPTQISSHDSSGNFDSYTQAFDNAGETSSQTPISGSMGSSSIYSYDTLGDQTTTTTGSATTSYGYNQAGQLTTASPSGSSYLYTSDGLEAARYPAPAWGAAATIDGTKNINSVSCVSSIFCIAGAASGGVLTYNGTGWSSVNVIDGTKGIQGVSCVNTSFCVAVDNDGNAFTTTNGGSSWTESTGIDGTKTINSVSCVSTTFCMAVDSNGNAIADNSGTWTVTSIDATRTINSVSCATTTFCVAVGSMGKAMVYTGTWAAAASVDGSTGINGVSCPSSTFCMAVANSGGALAYVNGTWASSATDIDGSTAVNAVSCNASLNTCEAVDNTGNAFSYNGSSWSSADNVDATKAIYSVSCASPTFCAAVDTSGRGLEDVASSATSQLTWDTNGSLSSVLSDASNDYIYGLNNEPVEQVNLSSSTPTYLTYTASDSSWLATNNAGQQVAFWRYDAFGNLATGTPDSPFGYSGQYTDASTGLVNDRARFYQSQTGSFTTRDPAFSSTDTAYAYAGGDPVNDADPNGDSQQTEGDTQAVSTANGASICVDKGREHGCEAVLTGDANTQLVVSRNSTLSDFGIEITNLVYDDTGGLGAKFTSGPNGTGTFDGSVELTGEGLPGFQQSTRTPFNLDGPYLHGGNGGFFSTTVMALGTITDPNIPEVPDNPTKEPPPGPSPDPDPLPPGDNPSDPIGDLAYHAPTCSAGTAATFLGFGGAVQYIEAVVWVGGPGTVTWSGPGVARPAVT